jgi:shikimate kinase
MSLIYLIGMPGAGKSYWGRLVAQRFLLPYTDLDRYITDRERLPVTEIFAAYGESGFRERERRYLVQLINKARPNSVIACGGGTPCYMNNMELMRQSGVTIYLKAEVATLLENLQCSMVLRPLLRDQEDKSAFLASLLADRKRFYEQAQYILPVENISMANFEQILSSCINRQ